jgi:hypothetical protein
METEISLLVKIKNNIHSQCSTLDYFINNEHINTLNGYANKELSHIVECYNSHNQHYVYLKQNHTILEKKINKYLYKNCNHIWEEDEIELNHERMKKIIYCLKCEMSKPV